MLLFARDINLVFNSCQLFDMSVQKILLFGVHTQLIYVVDADGQSLVKCSKKEAQLLNSISMLHFSTNWIGALTGHLVCKCSLQRHFYLLC